MTPGKLILLNGVTGSGKSSIATTLRAALPEPYLTARQKITPPPKYGVRRGLGVE